jgi:predicted phage terminase large subunit-like protein
MNTTSPPATPGQETIRVRERYYRAQRAGLDNKQAAAYAQSEDQNQPASPGMARADNAPAPEAQEDTRAQSEEGQEVVAVAAPTASASSDAPGRGAIHVPDRVVFRSLLAQNLGAFSEFAFSVVRPDAVFKPNWHLEAMSAKLSRVASGEIRRLIITVPPRNLKSLYTSVALPAWFLGHNPSERVVVISYSDLLARQHSNDFRRLVNDSIYQATFPAMRLDRDTDREITTTRRGKRIATSIEGTLTGLGGNLIIIDDPMKPGDAMSESVRARVVEWYRGTLLSRGDDKTKTRIVVVMQRVHQDDLVGYLLEQGGYEHLNLPAIAQRTEIFDLGERRIHARMRGELLHPEHEPASVLAELKRNMGPIAFSAQYQQNPIPPGGRIIKRKWLTYYDSIQTKPRDRIIVSWDIALSERETGDYSACVVLLRRGEVFYVLEVVRGRLAFDTLKRTVIQLHERYDSPTLLIEESPISKGLIQNLRGESINVTSSKPDTDKRSRLIAQTDLFVGGSVRLPRQAGWLEEFTAELLAFPGRHDDQVDALTQGLSWGRQRLGECSWGTYKI